MINKLINMEIPKAIELENNNGKYSIKDYATACINGMGEVQRNRFKKNS